MKKMLTCNILSGKVYYGTVNEKEGIYIEKEQINEEQFKVAMLNYIGRNLKGESEPLVLEVKGRLFSIELKSLE